MKKILCRAPVLTESGYGVHARQIARWLLENNYDVTFQCLNWGDTPWVTNRDAYDGLIGKIMDRSDFDNKKVYDITFQLQLPNEFDPKLGHFNVGISALVESDKCNPEWIHHCNNMDVMVVPSEFSKNVLLNTGKIETKLLVIPECFSDKIFTSDKKLELDVTTKYNFLVFGQLTSYDKIDKTDRKNTYNTLKWLCDTFKNNKEVGIVLKTNFGRMTKIDKLICTRKIKEILSKVRKTEFPKVYLLHGLMNEEDVAALYKNESIKALVTTTRGEGYGLPILEAAVSGLPVIATNWSGHLDYMGKGKFIDLSYTLSPIPKEKVDNKIWISGTQWAEVDEDNFKKRMIKFKEKPEIPEKWAKDLQIKLKDQYSYKAISSIWNLHFKDLLI
jgi:glycosyltransferase involved in cell wall biosynthesis